MSPPSDDDALPALQRAVLAIAQFVDQVADAAQATHSLGGGLACFDITHRLVQRVATSVSQGAGCHQVMGRFGMAEEAMGCIGRTLTKYSK